MFKYMFLAAIVLTISYAAHNSTSSEEIAAISDAKSRIQAAGGARNTNRLQAASITAGNLSKTIQ